MKTKFIVFFLMLFILLLTYINKEIIIEDKISTNINTDTEKLLTSDINKAKKVSLLYNDNQITMDLEEYVIGVVACEMPASFNIEALKALSVASRTYAMYKINRDENYILKTTTADQCYIDEDKMKEKWKDNYEKYLNKIKEAVNQTKNEILTYNNEPIIAFYFSISNGKTENVKNVFSQKLDYLVSVDSSYDKKYNYKEKTITISKNDFYKKLNINKIENIEIKKTISGRIDTISINDKTYKGTEFRKMFNLRSTDFNIEIEKENIIITTKGYGHGVGMSEYGANAMANEGYKYDEILYHYYLNTKIMNNY